MYDAMKQHVNAVLDEIRAAGLFKGERVLTTRQGVSIGVAGPTGGAGGKKVLNFCANNYLGLAGDDRLVAAAREGLERWGYGLSSVRFICGTQEPHKALERALSEFLGTEDTILYSSCFDANGGLFETLLGPDDAVISDQLNHASIIDGVRLCKAQRLRYDNADMADLESCLKEAHAARLKLIATDGVFSMDGTIAPLGAICDLADQYGAAVMIDDSHATGFLGKTGRGTPEFRSVAGRVDIITSTLGKAMGGATGGFTSGRKEVIQLLRQRSRPYLFSNTVPPVIVAVSLAVLKILSESTALRDTLEANTKYFRAGMAARGFNIPPGEHPIVPILLGEAALATKMADMLLAEGIYVVGFSYPVVPQGKARIRVQISAAHTREDLDAAMNAFAKVRDACQGK
ncbi:MAG: glycine C-acetyltransferase [Planctomycetota bacterium]|nr:glycine C-acetyltransferase [Planctomycetota bacterium]